MKQKNLVRKCLVISLSMVIFSSFVAAPGAAEAASKPSSHDSRPSSHGSRHEFTVRVFQHRAGNQVIGSDRDRVRRHVDEAMRRSQLVSPADVDVWTGEVSGEPFTAVLPKGASVNSASVVTDDAENAVGRGLAIEESTAPEDVPAPVVHGAATRGTPLREACRTIWFGVQGQGPVSANDQVYDCYEKFKLSSTSYIYNRYSKATLAQFSGSRRELHEFTIRFREAKGYARLKGGPYNYGPKPGSGDCNGLTFSYGPVSIPIKSCDSIKNMAGGSYCQTGTQYSGHENKQRYVDSYGRFASNGSEPIFSDYVWLTVRACGNVLNIPCVNSNNDYDDLWTDGLWSR